MADKFTSGPWVATTTPAGKGKVATPAGFSIANTTAGPYDEQCANAALMAAAPELLAALLNVTSLLSAYASHVSDGIVEVALSEARAAIAKAGGTP